MRVRLRFEGGLTNTTSTDIQTGIKAEFLSYSIELSQVYQIELASSRVS